VPGDKQKVKAGAECITEYNIKAWFRAQKKLMDGVIRVSVSVNKRASKNLRKNLGKGTISTRKKICTHQRSICELTCSPPSRFSRSALVHGLPEPGGGKKSPTSGQVLVISEDRDLKEG